jgi:hypothetical protein
MGLWSFIKGLFIDPRMEADEKVPLRRWTRSAIAIITGGDDYGYFPPEQVIVVLRGTWGVTDPESAESTIAELSQGETAWELVRALHVARMSVGAEYIDAEKGWELISPVAAKLQERYDSWEAVAEEYYSRRVVWAEETGEEIQTKEEFQSEIDITKSVYWQDIQFKHDLSAPTF